MIYMEFYDRRTNMPVFEWNRAYVYSYCQSAYDVLYGIQLNCAQIQVFLEGLEILIFSAQLDSDATHFLLRCIRMLVIPKGLENLYSSMTCSYDICINECISSKISHGYKEPVFTLHQLRNSYRMILTNSCYYGKHKVEKKRVRSL